MLGTVRTGSVAQSGRANRLRRRPEVALGVVWWRGVPGPGGVIVTDRLRSYGAAMKDFGVVHRSYHDRLVRWPVGVESRLT